MSSTERAPEPTMEEILASIRRIISDDESSSARQRSASASRQEDEGLEAAEGEADDRIINDIARVLSGSAPAVENEEDILDLTAELGGSETVEEVLLEEVVAPDEMPPVEILQPAPVAAEAPQSQAESAEPAAPPPLSASEEAASALERAIAALRAGQVPTSMGEFMPAPQPESSLASAFEAAPEPVPEPEPEPDFASEFEPEPELEPQLVLTDFAAETIVEETVVLEAPIESASEESAAGPTETAHWAGTPAPLVEPERPAARTNGGTHDASSLDTSHKTLEDSVKDMLRPMLRQWLDENMPRMVTAALKDELGDFGARDRGD